MRLSWMPSTNPLLIISPSQNTERCYLQTNFRCNISQTPTDLHCYAAFSGCSSTRTQHCTTISNLMHLVESDHLSKVYYFEVSSPAVANVIGEQTGATPTVFQSCHTLTQTDFDNGEYLCQPDAAKFKGVGIAISPLERIFLWLLLHCNSPMSLGI